MLAIFAWLDESAHHPSNLFLRSYVLLSCPFIPPAVKIPWRRQIERTILFQIHFQYRFFFFFLITNPNKQQQLADSLHRPLAKVKRFEFSDTFDRRRVGILRWKFWKSHLVTTLNIKIYNLREISWRNRFAKVYSSRVYGMWVRVSNEYNIIANDVYWDSNLFDSLRLF